MSTLTGDSLRSESRYLRWVRTGRILLLAGTSSLLVAGCALGLDLNGSPGDFYDLDADASDNSGGDTGDADTESDDTGTQVTSDTGSGAEISTLNLSPGLCFRVGPVEMDASCSADADIAYFDSTFRSLGDAELCILAGSFESIDEVPNPLPNCTSTPTSYRGFSQDAFVIGEGDAHYLVYIVQADGRGSAQIQIQERE